jgi:hypothetical protein
MISETIELSAYLFSDRINIGIMFLFMLSALIFRYCLRDIQMPFIIEDVVESFRALGLAVRRLTTSWSAQEGMRREVEVALSDSPIRTREARDAEVIANAQEDRAAGTRTWLERRQEIENQRTNLLRSIAGWDRLIGLNINAVNIDWLRLQRERLLQRLRDLPDDTITVTYTGPPPEMREGENYYLQPDGSLSRNRPTDPGALIMPVGRRTVEEAIHRGVLPDLVARMRERIKPEEDPPKEEPRPSRMIRAKDQSDFLVDKEDGVDDA